MARDPILAEVAESAQPAGAHVLVALRAGADSPAAEADDTAQAGTAIAALVSCPHEPYAGNPPVGI